jgi:hypothetical protein
LGPTAQGRGAREGQVFPKEKKQRARRLQSMVLRALPTYPESRLPYF